MRVLPLLDRTESSVGILPVLLRGNELYALEQSVQARMPMLPFIWLHFEACLQGR